MTHPLLHVPARIGALVLTTVLVLAAGIAPAGADADDELEAAAAAHGMSAGELLDAVPYVNGDADLGFEARKGGERGGKLGKLRADQAREDRARAAATEHDDEDDGGPGLGPEIRPPHAGPMTKAEREALKAEWAEAKAARKAARKAAKAHDDDDDDGAEPGDEADDDDDAKPDKARKRGKKPSDRTHDDDDDGAEPDDEADDDDGDAESGDDDD